MFDVSFLLLLFLPLFPVFFVHSTSFLELFTDLTQRGDIVNIIAKNDTGTWIGSCNGKIGHFKFINVEEIPECRPGYHPFGCCSSTSICHPSMSHVSSSSSSVIPDCTSSSSSVTSVMVTPDTTSSRCNNKCNSNCLLPLTVTSSTGNCSSCHASGVESESGTKVCHNHHRPRINLKKSTTSEMTGASHVVVSTQQAKYQDMRYNSRQKSQMEGESILSNNKNTRVIRSRRKVSEEEREQFSRMKDFLMKKNASSSCSGGHFTQECNTATCIEQTSSPEFSSPLDLSLTVGQFFHLLSLGLPGNEYAALVSSKGFPDLKSLMFQVSVQEVEDLLSSCISNATHLDFILNSLDFLRDLSSTPKTDNEGRDRELKSGESEAAGGEQEDTLSSEKNRSEMEKNNKKNNPNMNSSGKKTMNESDFTPGHNLHARVSCYVHSSSPSCCCYSCSCSVGLPPSSQPSGLPAKIEQRRGSASSDNNSRNASSLIPSLRSNKKNEQKHHPSPSLTAKSAPSTPALELTTDDLTNWFKNKLHFFSG